MARTRSAGDLFFKVAFDKRETVDDGAGNTVGEWQEQFQCRAGYAHLLGRVATAEAIMAARLQGQHAQVIFVRRSAASHNVTLDWRIRDVRTGTEFNIRDITPTDDRAWIDFLCQTGVAAG